MMDDAGFALTHKTYWFSLYAFTRKIHRLLLGAGSQGQPLQAHIKAGVVHHGEHIFEYMFAMMNHARLDVGLQGLALASRAQQQAVNFARERVQGKPVGFVGQGKASIIHHPDVRRLLISMKARVCAMRGLLYEVAAARDLVRANGDEKALRKVELLTPVAKGW